MKFERFEKCLDRIENIATDAAQEFRTEHGVTVGKIAVFANVKPETQAGNTDIIGHIAGSTDPDDPQHSKYVMTRTPHPCEIIHDCRTNAVARLWVLGEFAERRSRSLRLRLKRSLIKAMHHRTAAPAYSDRHVLLINHPDRTTYNVDSDGIRRPAYKRVFHDTYKGLFLQMFILEKLLNDHPDVSSIDWTRSRKLARLSATDYMMLP